MVNFSYQLTGPNRELHINTSSSKKYQEDNLYISDLLSLCNLIKLFYPGFSMNSKREIKIDLMQNTCIKEKATHTLFPVSGQFFLFVLMMKQLKLFYFHNTTNELTQVHIDPLPLATFENIPVVPRHRSWCFRPWPRYFEYLGIEPGPNNSLTMEEYTNMVHPRQSPSPEWFRHTIQRKCRIRKTGPLPSLTRKRTMNGLKTIHLHRQAIRITLSFSGYLHEYSRT